MADICPTVTPYSLEQYSEQLARVRFAPRLHLDFMDGKLTKTTSPKLRDITLPPVDVDLHIMYKQPATVIEEVISLRPKLVIVHAEAEGNFLDLAEKWHKAGIKVGVALLPDTQIEAIEPAIRAIDHVLIFSGSLGSFGGHADLRLLQKVAAIKMLKPELEVGWDGGINDENIADLIAGGVDVLNVGGYIQRANDPRTAYATLKAIEQRA
jgi:ribulose-phosphate 3-epimerase